MNKINVAESRMADQKNVLKNGLNARILTIRTATKDAKTRMCQAVT
jgi:hypothetical protein